LEGEREGTAQRVVREVAGGGNNRRNFRPEVFLVSACRAESGDEFEGLVHRLPERNAQLEDVFGFHASFNSVLLKNASSSD